MIKYIMSLTFDDVKIFVYDNSTTIVLILLTIAVIYINLKVNNLDYKVQQTIIYSPLKSNDRSYPNYTCTNSFRWI